MFLNFLISWFRASREFRFASSAQLGAWPCSIVSPGRGEREGSYGGGALRTPLVDIAAIAMLFIVLELNRATWLVALRSPTIDRNQSPQARTATWS